MMSARERRLTMAFVELADTLVDDFDVVEFLHVLTRRCVQLLDVEAAGLLLADHHGQLQLMAASSEQSPLLELLRLQTRAGPCVGCYRSGEPVQAGLGTPDPRWPQLSRPAVDLGFQWLQALPMRLREEIVGVLGLFGKQAGGLTEADRRVGQALADVATIGLLQERAIRRRQVMAEQLQTALNTRVVVEQAKGVLAERLQVDMETAFRVLRRYSRGHNRHLTEVATAVVSDEADFAGLAATDRRPQIG